MKEDDVVTLEINFDEGELIFYCNNVSLGVAYRD